MGSVEKWKRGRYRARWRDDEGRSQSKVFDYKADAVAYLDRVEADIERGNYMPSAERRKTMGAYVVDDWLPAQAWRPQTRDAFDSHWRRHLGPRWGAVPLAQIRRTHVQAWVNDLAETLAPATVEAIYRRFVSIVRASADDGIIDRLPTVRIALPSNKTNARVAVPTAEEVAALAEAMTPRYRAMVWTGATLGLRPSETAGLTVDRVNFLRREVIIDRQLAAPSGRRPYLSPPKTHAGERTLPAPAELLDRLAVHLERYGTGTLDTGEALVFSSRTGSPVRRSMLQDAWKRAAAKVELRGELRGWHSLRHYAITRLIAAGVNPDYVRQFAGHESLTETLEVYSGWWPSDADEARDVLTRALETGT